MLSVKIQSLTFSSKLKNMASIVKGVIACKKSLEEQSRNRGKEA